MSSINSKNLNNKNKNYHIFIKDITTISYEEFKDALNVNLFDLFIILVMVNDLKLIYITLNIKRKWDFI